MEKKVAKLIADLRLQAKFARRYGATLSDHDAKIAMESMGSGLELAIDQILRELA